MLDLCSQCICTYHVEWSKYKIKSKFDVWPLMVVFLLHQPCKLTLTADRALGRHSRVPQPDCYRHTHPPTELKKVKMLLKSHSDFGHDSFSVTIHNLSTINLFRYHLLFCFLWLKSHHRIARKQPPLGKWQRRLAP